MPNNIEKIIKMLTLLGFVVHPNKIFAYSFSEDRIFRVSPRFNQHDHFSDRNQKESTFLTLQ